MFNLVIIINALIGWANPSKMGLASFLGIRKIDKFKRSTSSRASGKYRSEGADNHGDICKVLSLHRYTVITL